MKIDNFVRDIKKRALDALMQIDHSGALETQHFEFEAGRAELSTIRGNAVEKATIAHMDLRGIPMPGSGERFDSTVYQMEIFPRNPHCPMGHFNTEWSTVGGTIVYNMNLDLFPAVAVEEDLGRVEKQMGAVAERFGRDPGEGRDGLHTQYNMPHWSTPLTAGAGLQLKQLTQTDLELFATAYSTLFDAYVSILKRRKDSAYSEVENLRAMARNNKWLEYITLKDRAIKAAQGIGIPPEVIVGFSYPPRCGF